MWSRFEMFFGKAKSGNSAKNDTQASKKSTLSRSEIETLFAAELGLAKRA